MKNKITDLRNHLFETIEKLLDEEPNGMTVEKAKAIAGVADKIIDTAKVEIEYMNALGDMPTEIRAISTGFLPDKTS